MHRSCLSFIVSLCAVLLIAVGTARAETIRFAVLAFRSPEQTVLRWQPTIDNLQTALPQHQFQLIPLAYEGLNQAVDKGQVDFILTNPEHYVALRQKYGLAAIATLMPSEMGHPMTAFGGVIVSRAGAQEPQKIEDLAGRIIASPSIQSFGGYLTQGWELQKRDIKPDSFIFTGMPHDRAIQELMDGRAAAAFVRTGVLEAMFREGALQRQQIKVINQQTAENFPQLRSTDLYPEWPLVVAPHVPEPIIKAVTLSVLQIRPDDLAAKRGDYFGFSPPGDYAAIEALMLRMRVGPGRLELFDLRDVMEKYSMPIVGGLLFLLTMGSVFIVLLTISNRRLRQTSQKSQQLANELHKTTDELRQTITKLEKSNSELERFGVVAAHDLQEPVRLIVSFTQLLDRRYSHVLDDQGRNFMEYITNAALRIRNLVRDLMSYSNAINGALDFQLIDCSAIAQNAIHLLTSQPGYADINLDLHPLPMVWGDEVGLVQVFFQLLENAAKFSQTGHPAQISIFADKQPDGMWQISFRDHGIGIAPEFREQVFSIFKRLHPAETFPGTGLGLALCRQIVERHGGSIWIDDAPEQGCIVRLTLPSVTPAGNIRPEPIDGLSDSPKSSRYSAASSSNSPE